MYRKAVRTAQNWFPGLREIKNGFYHWSRSTFGLLHDRDFALIGRLPVREDDLFLDVGANRGQSILSLKRMRPDAEVVSFEPDPAMFRWLQARFGQRAGVRLVNVGLGAEAARRTLHTPCYRGFAYDGLATFSAETARRYLSSDTLYGFDPAKLTVVEAECETRTLDSFELKPTFIKIDVEGLEHEVLAGGAFTLIANEPVLMVERFHDNPMLEPMLNALGYVEVRARIGTEGRGFARGHTSSENMICMTPRRLAAVQAALDVNSASPALAHGRSKLETVR
jgi:FkbM family methyltransferase